MTTTDRIAAHVAAHPGVRYADLCAAIGIKRRSGHIAYAVNTGRVFSAGVHGDTRLYATRGEAEAAEPQLRRAAELRRADVKKRADEERNRRRKAANRILGRSRNTRPAQAVHGDPSVGEFVVAGRVVRVALAQGVQDAPRVVDSAECRPWARVAAGLILGAHG
jgi:hypothetical protein